MKQKWLYRLAGVAVLGILILLLPFIGRASGSEAGSANGKPTEQGTEAVEETKLVLDIYRVGNITMDTGTGMPRYEMITGQTISGAAVAGSSVTGSAVTGSALTGGSAGIDTESWEQLAQGAARYVLTVSASGTLSPANSPVLPPVVSGAAIGSLKEGEDSSLAVSVDWRKLLPSSEQNGIYLLVTRGAKLIKPEEYVKILKEALTGSDGQARELEHITTIAKSSTHTYEFEPLLLFQAADGTTGGGNTGGTGDGSSGSDTGNNGQIVLKPGRVDRNGSLEVVKTLLTYNTAEPVTFVFSVEATSPDGRNVYSDVINMTFTAAGTQRKHISNIPVGAKVVVKEVYSGISYFLVSDGEQTVTIPATGTVTASFTNDYNPPSDDTPGGGGGNPGGGGGSGGYGITNHFEYGVDPKTGISGWEWYQLDNIGENVAQEEAD